MNSPCYETPKRKKIEQKHRERKKNGEKRATFFCDEPRHIVWFLSRVVKLPLVKTPKKTPKNQGNQYK
jgi:hypothetical protein